MSKPQEHETNRGNAHQRLQTLDEMIAVTRGPGTALVASLQAARVKTKKEVDDGVEQNQ